MEKISTYREKEGGRSGEEGLEELILNASRMMVEILAQCLLSAETEGITPAQFRILDMVHGKTDKPAEIAAMLGISPPAVTSLLERLEERGLLERKAGREDRRRVELALTSAGEELVRKVNRCRRAKLRKLLEKLDGKSRASLRESLELLYKAYLDTMAR